MIGVPKYDQATCIAYVIDKLQTNGFKVRYTHPNLLLISWQHWVPAYVRAEIKKKTGISIDGFGNIKNEEKEEIQELTMKNNKPTHIIKNNNDKRPIKEYKPTGKLIYNSNLLNTLK